MAEECVSPEGGTPSFGARRPELVTVDARPERRGAAQPERRSAMVPERRSATRTDRRVAAPVAHTEQFRLHGAAGRRCVKVPGHAVIGRNELEGRPTAQFIRRADEST